LEKGESKQRASAAVGLFLAKSKVVAAPIDLPQIAILTELEQFR